MKSTGRLSGHRSCSLARCLAAAAQGDTTAYFDLGVAFSTGSHGVECDLIEAHKWFNLAAAQGHEEAALVPGRHFRRDDRPRNRRSPAPRARMAAARSAAGRLTRQRRSPSFLNGVRSPRYSWSAATPSRSRSRKSATASRKPGSAIQCADHVCTGSYPRASLCPPCAPASTRVEPALDRGIDRLIIAQLEMQERARRGCSPSSGRRAPVRR